MSSYSHIRQVHRTVILLLLLVPGMLPAQVLNVLVKKDQTISEDTYGRKTLSFLIAAGSDMPGQYREWVEHYAYINYADVQARFDQIALSSSYLPVPISAAQQIAQEIRMRHHPNEVLARMWSRSATGSFGFDYMEARTMYNATDWEKMVAGGLYRGTSAILDQAEDLIRNTYFVVMVPDNIRTMEEYYDEQDNRKRNAAQYTGKPFVPVQRTDEGFVGRMQLLFFRLEFDDQIALKFFEEMWVDEQTPENARQSRMGMFDTYDFPVSYRFDKVTLDITSSQPKIPAYSREGNQLPRLTEAELFREWMKKGWLSGLHSLESVFLLTQSISNITPVRAKLGIKEGVDPGQRYHIYEYVSTGGVHKKRKLVGVLKSTARRPSLAELQRGDRSTTFVQSYGRMPDLGMLVEEHQDIGIGVSVLGGTGSTGGLQVRADANLSTFAGKQGINLGTDLRLGVSIAFDRSESEAHSDFFIGGFERVGTPYSFSRVEAQVFKDIYPSRMLVIQPGIGLGLMDASHYDAEAASSVDLASTLYVNTSLGIGVPVAPVARLLLIGNYIAPFGETALADGVSPISLSAHRWKDYFPNKAGMSLQLGLHIDFL